ncbi:MAG: hypothetical protein IPJ75_13260 [Ignavibacteriales bacterium]|nr:hypothetical protein [Ignavibacteriales bacterium]
MSDSILILLTVTFILLEVSSFPIKLRAILGDPKQAFPQFTNFIIDMKRFMVLKTMINLAAGILVGIWMYILGVQFPVLWGFLAFLYIIFQIWSIFICNSGQPFLHLFNWDRGQQFL